MRLINMVTVSENALIKVWDKFDTIQTKQSKRPKKSPLPKNHGFQLHQCYDHLFNNGSIFRKSWRKEESMWNDACCSPEDPSAKKFISYNEEDGFLMEREYPLDMDVDTFSMTKDDLKANDWCIEPLKST